MASKYKRPEYGICPPEPIVYCSECVWFTRDTEGLSFRIDTGEYFMGECDCGYSDSNNAHHHVFADKPRKCKCFRQRKE